MTKQLIINSEKLLPDCTAVDRNGQVGEGPEGGPRKTHSGTRAGHGREAEAGGGAGGRGKTQGLNNLKTNCNGVKKM